MGAYAEAEEQSNRPQCVHIAWAVLGLVIMQVVVLLALCAWGDRDKLPQYSVQIEHISGVNPAADLRGGAPLDPVFNLTVFVSSASLLYGACIKPGTSIKVSYSYQGLPMAAGRVPEACVGRLGGSSEKQTVPVVARGTGVSVPGFLLDSLAEQMRRGDAVFVVELIESRRDNTEFDKTMICGARIGTKSPCQQRPYS